MIEKTYQCKKNGEILNDSSMIFDQNFNLKSSSEDFAIPFGLR